MKKMIAVVMGFVFVALVTVFLMPGCSGKGKVSGDGGNDGADADAEGPDDGGDEVPGDDGGSPADDGGGTDGDGDAGQELDGGSETGCGDVPASAVYVSDHGVLGNGTDETDKITAAIAAAAEHSSKTLVFPAGMTITSAKQIRFTEGLTVIGNGCTIKLKDTTHTDGVQWQWIYAHPGVRICGMIFDGNHQNGNETQTHGIMLQGDNIFDGNTVRNVHSYSIGVYYNEPDHPPSNIYITGNTIIDSHQYGISTGCTDGEYCYGHNIVITGNTITDCDEVGIKIRGTVGATIENNTITLGDRTGDEPSGIRLYSWDEPNRDIVIQHNTIIGLGEDPSDGICSDDELNTNIIIHANTVQHTHNGLRLNINNATITDNIMTDCAYGFTSTGTGNTISGNTCDGSPCP